MKRQSIILAAAWLLIILILGASVFPVKAQTPESPVYTLGINRDFGYGAGSQIRGLFTVKIAGPEEIAQVEYLIDGQPMTIVTASPFSFQFNTSSYPAGEHELTANVTALDGKVYITPARHFNFVTQAQEGEGMQKILIPLLGGIFAVLLLTMSVQGLIFRSRKHQGVPPGTERHYGYAGGSICPKCKRPTPRHITGFNIGIGKFDYCENCGKWSVMRAVPLEILRTAEIAEKADAHDAENSSLYEKSDEEKMRDLLDKSKYEDR